MGLAAGRQAGWQAGRPGPALPILSGYSPCTVRKFRGLGGTHISDALLCSK